jgi:Kef-type K+ transport system membrane component KefB
MSHSPLLLQIVVILACGRILGAVLRFYGQPMVVGEMIAGLLLGPAVFGVLAPDTQHALFQDSSLPQLDAISQLGLVLFMLVVGAELRLPAGAKAQIRAATWVGVLSVLLPMALGFAAAMPLYPMLAAPGLAFWPFALFFAAAMSITAFPVMARILKDRGETQTRIGRLALTSAALADVLCWVLLAILLIIAGSGNDWSRIVRMLVALVALCAVLFGVVRPLIAWLVARYARDGSHAAVVLATLAIGALASSYVTAYIGVHAVFGAFLFGACLPRDDRLLHFLIERIEHVAVVVLLPVFFALAGLSTTADAFAGAGAGNLLLILAVAVGGKLVGGSAAARITGESWRSALAVGSLMNARGLMELIVMKVGLDAGLIGKQAFTLFLVMAIVTTVMTGPLLNLFGEMQHGGRAAERCGESSAGERPTIRGRHQQ